MNRWNRGLAGAELRHAYLGCRKGGRLVPELFGSFDDAIFEYLVDARLMQVARNHKGDRISSSRKTFTVNVSDHGGVSAWPTSVTFAGVECKNETAMT